MRTVYRVSFTATDPRYGYMEHASGMMAFTSRLAVAQQALVDMQRMAERETVPFTSTPLAHVGHFAITSRQR